MNYQTKRFSENTATKLNISPACGKVGHLVAVNVWGRVYENVIERVFNRIQMKIIYSVNGPVKPITLEQLEGAYKYI